MRGILLAAAAALPACGYPATVTRSVATGTQAPDASSLVATLLYPGNNAREASADQGGNVWIATASGVVVLPSDGGASITFDADAGLPDDDVRCASGGVPGQALVGFGPQLQSGADQIDLMTLASRGVTDAPKVFDITGEIVEANHVVYDASRHQYWIGTNEGVSMLSAAGDPIEHRHPVHPHGATLGLAVTPGGDVWDGDQFQLSKLNAGPQADFDASFNPVLQPWIQSGQDIAAVLVDGTGNIWAGSLDRGLVMLNPNTLAVQAWPLAAGLPSLSVQSLALDPDGSIWVATDTGLGRLDPSAASWQVYRAAPVSPGSALPSDDVIDVTVDTSQSPRRVIVTTSLGVVAYDGT